jgi:hypothetical protein
MAGYPAQRYLDQYVRDNRSVWLQELEMPPAARLELQRFLEWNALPEHRFYHYDYYLDNCSTRVRDALDRFLGGRIREHTESLPTDQLSLPYPAPHCNDLPTFTGLLLPSNRDRLPDYRVGGDVSPPGCGSTRAE